MTGKKTKLLFLGNQVMKYVMVETEKTNTLS